MTARFRLLVVSTAAAVLAAAIAALLAGSGAAIAQGALKPLQALVVNTDASPVPVEVIGGAVSSHLGVPIEDHVMLVRQGSTQTPCSLSGSGPGSEFRRIHPDGSVEAETFVVPLGRQFVVTDVDAVVIAGDLNTFNSGRVVLAAIMEPASFNSVAVPHRSSGVTILNATTQAVAVSSVLGAGVVFGPGEQICIRGEELDAGAGLIRRDVTRASIRGYLL
ncbi:MAG: hypothetical protein ACREI8_05410 [Myxococcota bacterium]